MVIAVLAVITGTGLLAFGRDSSDRIDTPAAGTAPTPSATALPPSAAPALVPSPTSSAAAGPTLTEAVFTGRSSGNELTVAVGVKDGRAAGYLCDGNKVEAWLEGTLSGDQLSLHGRNADTGITATVGQRLPSRQCHGRWNREGLCRPDRGRRGRALREPP